MRASLSFAALLAIAAAAPAPQFVTVVQTATQVVNPDGTLYTSIAAAPVAAAAAAPAAAAPVAAAPAAAASPAADTSDSDSFATSASDSIISWLQGLFGDFTSSSSSAAPAAAAPVAASPVNAQQIATSAAPVAYAAAYTPVADETSSAAAASSSPSYSSSSSSSSSSGIDSSSGVDSDFAKEILDAHNQKRSLHSAPPLTWNTDAYNYAQAYADKYDCSGVLTHSHGPYGENLAAGYKSGTASLDAWYDEGSTYSYSAANSYDHFTQVVWKSTTSVGCAYKDCSSHNWGLYVICSYDPAGNVIGENAANVLPS